MYFNFTYDQPFDSMCLFFFFFFFSIKSTPICSFVGILFAWFSSLFMYVCLNFTHTHLNAHHLNYYIPVERLFFLSCAFFPTYWFTLFCVCVYIFARSFLVFFFNFYFRKCLGVYAYITVSFQKTNNLILKPLFILVYLFVVCL